MRFFTGKRKRHRQIALGLLVLGGAYCLYTAARIHVLRGNAARLIASANRWPREYSLHTQNPRELVIVVMGDSTAVGVGASRLEDTFPFQVATATATNRRVRVINLAVSGARLSDVLKNQLPQIKRLKPQLISISIGANDATHFSSEAQYQKEVAALYAKLKESKAIVLIASTPDMAQIPALPWPLALAMGRRSKMQNRILQKSLLQNKAKSNIHYVDLFHRGKLVYAQNPDFYAPDFFHPSASGYQIWASLFIETLQSAA